MRYPFQPEFASNKLLAVRSCRAWASASARRLFRRCLAKSRHRGATASSPAGYRGLPGLPHFAAKAKRVIFLCMAGGPSHLETFDYKPKLAELHDQPMPESYTKGQPIAQLQGQELKAYGPMFKFDRYGKSGQWISELLPWQQKMVDDICIVRSMVTEQINHDPAHTFMNCGTAISGRPSMGAWINYGLGSRDGRSAGLRRAHQRRRARAGPADRLAAVELRLFAEPISRRRVQLERRPGSLRSQPRRRAGRTAAGERRRRFSNSTVTATSGCRARKCKRESPRTKRRSACRRRCPS